MAKKVDITEKLEFDSNPLLVIKDKEYEVNADAETVLKILGILGTEGTGPSAITKMYELIFSEKERKAIEKLKLQFKDFKKIVENAIDLIIDEGEDKGE